MKKVEVELYKPNGKYCATEDWEVPETANHPVSMMDSPNFHRIDGGPVLITSEGWGFPHLLLRETWGR